MKKNKKLLAGVVANHKHAPSKIQIVKAVVVKKSKKKRIVCQCVDQSGAGGDYEHGGAIKTSYCTLDHNGKCPDDIDSEL